MNVTIEKKKTDCNALPKGWQREEVLRKSGLSAGKVDVYYYSPAGKKIDSKPQLARQLGDTLDVSQFDFQSGKLLPNAQQQQQLSMQRASQALKRKLPPGTTSAICTNLPSQLSTLQGQSLLTSALSSSATNSSSTTTLTTSSSSSSLRHSFDFSRGIRPDVSLVPPIRQTASIFKQPVTVYKTQESKVKTDLKHGTQDKPKQIFWEKRLEGLQACDIMGAEFSAINLPKGLKPVGPKVCEQTLLQSVATALHVLAQPVTGQTASKPALQANAGIFVNPEQPLMHMFSITDEDIRKQEDRVNIARRRLSEALRAA